MAHFVRDCIHGDIRLNELQTAIINTREFQRLRYIKQNGLLHFIFPGATHTRFAHSIGTMHLAKKVYFALFWFLSSGVQSKELLLAEKYIRDCFFVAALLHDVGHCAFSHSLEQTRFRDGSILGNLTLFSEMFSDSEFRDQLINLQSHGQIKLDEKKVSHEIAGSFITGRILRNPDVSSHLTDFSVDDFIQDVRALVNELPFSDTFRNSVRELHPLFSNGIASGPILGEENLNLEGLPDRVQRILVNLLSSSLDIDRMDYLARDSHYAGVPYGNIDSEYLIQNLRLLSTGGGKLALGLNEKALHSLDDMLWSRYQMFVQVYSHKSNVALNLVLGQAIDDAIDLDIILRPTDAESLLSFTDDYVIANVLVQCLKGTLQESICAQVLLDRSFPEHIEKVSLKSEDEDKWEELIRAKKERIAQTRGIDFERILSGGQSSKLIKGVIPLIIRRPIDDKPIELVDFKENSLLFQGGIRPSHRIEHLYIINNSVQ